MNCEKAVAVIVCGWVAVMAASAGAGEGEPPPECDEIQEAIFGGVHGPSRDSGHFL